MEPFGRTSLLLAAFLSLVMAVRAIRKRSLTKSGAIAGCTVGFLLVATGLRGLLLLFFYQLGSWATKVGADRKAQQDGTVHSARGATQVLCVSLTPVVLSLWHAIQCGAERPIDFCHNNSTTISTMGEEDDDEQQYTTRLASTLACAIVAHHATSLADTLASELGMLSNEQPILITQPRRQVPPGTNGGITKVGTGCSILGGAIIGLLAVVLDGISGLQPLYNHYAGELVVYGGLCGLLGSLVDSLLGATVQITYYDADDKRIYHADDTARHHRSTIAGRNWLTNEQVNFVSALLTAIVGGWVLAPWVFWDGNSMEHPVPAGG